jgi:Putative lumazine-binding
MTPRAPLALLCAALLAAGLAACGSSVSTSGFKGEQRQVAQVVADLQKHASALEANKICEEDLAAANVARLNAQGGCKKALETQLKQIESFEATVESVHITGKTATAKVKSIHSGRNAIQTMAFVKERGKWRASGVS